MNAVLQKVISVPDKIRSLMEKRKWVLPSFLSLVLFALAIWGIGDFNQLLLYDDEFGYWMASAYLTGTDWTSVGSGINYYSYGYGFLILTPIRLIFSSPANMYRAAIVANGLLLVGSYWIARNVTRQLFEDINQMLIDVVCFVVMLYPSNITFSHIAWAECALVFVFWVFVWLSLRVIEKPTLLNHIAIAVNVMILYVVHQRTIAVAIATCMVMVWKFFVDKDKESRKRILAFVGTMAILIIVHKIIKTDLIDTYYYNNARVAHNNIEGQMDTVLEVVTGSKALQLLQSMMGKWFYLFVATFYTAWWSAQKFFGDAILYFKSFGNCINKKGGKATKEIKEGSQNSLLWSLWLLLAFGGNFLVTSMFMIGGGRNDMLVYGRYNEYMIGFYFIVGIICFIRDSKWVNKMLIYVPVGLLCAWLCQTITDQYESTSYQAYHSICTALFMEKGVPSDGRILAYAMTWTGIALLILILIKAKAWKHADMVRKALIVLPIIVLFYCTSSKMVFGTVTEKQLLRIVNIQNVVSWIDIVDDDMSQNVYYLSNTESRYWSESFQFLLAEKPLTVIHSDEVDLTEDAFYLVGNGFLDWEGFDDHFYCIKESNQFALVVNKYGQLAENARMIKGE